MSKHHSKPPRHGEGKRGTDGPVGYLLIQAAGVFRQRMARALAPLEVTPPQFSVMTMIRAYPGISNADLARLALLTPQTLSVIVANLLRDGAVVRSPHPVHGRVLQLELTMEGHTLLAECRRRVKALERALENGLSAEQAALLRHWLVEAARTP